MFLYSQKPPEKSSLGSSYNFTGKTLPVVIPAPASWGWRISASTFSENQVGAMGKGQKTQETDVNRRCLRTPKGFDGAVLQDTKHWRRNCRNFLATFQIHAEHFEGSRIDTTNVRRLWHETFMQDGRWWTFIVSWSLLRHQYLRAHFFVPPDFPWCLVLATQWTHIKGTKQSTPEKLHRNNWGGGMKLVFPWNVAISWISVLNFRMFLLLHSVCPRGTRAWNAENINHLGNLLWNSKPLWPFFEGSSVVIYKSPR